MCMCPAGLLGGREIAFWQDLQTPTVPEYLGKWSHGSWRAYWEIPDIAQKLEYVPLSGPMWIHARCAPWKRWNIEAVLHESHWKFQRDIVFNIDQNNGRSKMLEVSSSYQLCMSIVGETSNIFAVWLHRRPILEPRPGPSLNLWVGLWNHPKSNA